MTEPSRALPDIDFATFILSLASSALMHLGEMPEGAPAEEEPQRDLALAKQTIDIIAMLRDKTRGNLDDGEQKLIDTVLYDLRVKFVDAAKR